MHNIGYNISKIYNLCYLIYSNICNTYIPYLNNMCVCVCVCACL